MAEKKKTSSKAEEAERMSTVKETASDIINDNRSEAAQSSGPIDAPAPPAEFAESQEIDWKDKFLRAKADFQNLQRRLRDEQHAAVRFANAEFAKPLLEVIDDFERTFEAGQEQSNENSLTSGIKLIYDKLLKMLKDHDIESIESLGQPFDPRFHEAIQQMPSEEHPPNTVIQEIQKGFRMHDRVLRPARVIVSRSSESVADDEHINAQA